MNNNCYLFSAYCVSVSGPLYIFQNFLKQSSQQAQGVGQYFHFRQKEIKAQNVRNLLKINKS